MGGHPGMRGMEDSRKGLECKQRDMRKLGSDGCVYYLDFIDDFMVYTYFKTSNFATKVFTEDFVLHKIQQKAITFISFVNII